MSPNTSPSDRHFFADLEGSRRRGWRGDDVAFFKGFGEVVAQHCAHALRLFVIGVVVAGRQRERAEHDAAFDLSAKTFIACMLIHLGKACGLLRHESRIARRQSAPDSTTLRRWR